jgi:hypothetical protein
MVALGHHNIQNGIDYVIRRFDERFFVRSDWEAETADIVFGKKELHWLGVVIIHESAEKIVSER